MKKKNVIDRACAELAGFEGLYGLMRRRMSISGKSQSTLNHYAHHVVKMALHLQVIPTELNRDFVY